MRCIDECTVSSSATPPGRHFEEEPDAVAKLLTRDEARRMGRADRTSREPLGPGPACA